MPEFSKLQIRAKVLSVISELKSIPRFNDELLQYYCGELSQIEDKKALFDIYIKEFIKLDEKDYTFSSLLLKAVVDNDYINEKALEMLQSQSLSDECKYKIVQMLRIIGGDCDYTTIPTYFDNPEEVLDKETKRLLESAVFNPEAMLDFLDFISAVSYSDRSLLLQSLKLDYEGDVLANIVYPILYSDFEDDFKLDVIDILSDSKSSIAIAPFNYLIEVSDNKNIVNACKIGLKKLKLSGAKEEIADEYFRNVVKTSMPFEFFTTIPDGNGNQALLVSRCSEDRKCLLSAVVINDRKGIVDCFGFYNISDKELIKVISKFYQSEGKYKVNQGYIKTQIDNAINTNIKNKRLFPYEFICWSPLTSDFAPLDYSLEDYIKTNCKMTDFEQDEFLTLLTKEYTMRWFITPEENSIINDLVEKIYNLPELDIEEINNSILSNIDNILNDDAISLWKNRIVNLIYLLHNNSDARNADIFYTMLNDEKYFKMFKSILLQRSVFNYFVAKKENLKDSKLTTNIFRLRNKSEEKYDIKKIEKIIEFLKRNWLDG
jgi:hypothetical protein